MKGNESERYDTAYPSQMKGNNTDFKGFLPLIADERQNSECQRIPLQLIKPLLSKALQRKGNIRQKPTNELRDYKLELHSERRKELDDF